MAANMMEAFELLPDLKVVSVLSSSHERAMNFAGQFNIPKVCQTLESLLDDSNVDAVYIASATESHFKMTMAALKKGKSVLCEKPISVSSAESRLIEHEAKRVNALCMEAMWTHCLPAYHQLFAICQTDGFGKATHLYADFGYPVSSISQPRLFIKSDGCGVLLDRGVYPVALAVKLFGNVKSVVARVNYSEAGVDTHANLLLVHEGARQSVLSVSFDVLLQNRAVLSCTRGAVGLEPPILGSERISIQSFHSESAFASESSDGVKIRIKRRLKQSALLRRVNGLKSAGEVRHCAYGANQYVPVLKHFVDLMRAGAKQSPLLPLSFSTEVLRVIDLAKNRIAK